jgi:UDP-N-acetylglucosamine--N-acetylmuramyl-(pentapeptide) pyrophosphoryl-undecaprenol N-acetylglucosamine transferase
MKILIAAGGTGGHLFPGIALAEAFKEKDDGTAVLFVGTGRDLDKRTMIPAGCDFEAIDAAGVKGKNPLRVLAALLHIGKGIMQALLIIRRFAPQLVLGMGGYVSAPVLAAAYLLRVKRAIHEQNVLPGLTNRSLGRIADRIFTSFQESERYFPPGKAVLAGNPLRKQHLQGALLPPPARPFTVLISGGSLGSHQINCALIDALQYLLPLRDELRLIHQTGATDLEPVREAYRERGFTAEAVPFIDHMAGAYRRAHLIVCRAGATTLAELMVHGKASILIPYPWAADNHQHHNAMFLVSRGAATILDPSELSGRTLAERILQLYRNPDDLSAMGANAGRLGKPEAARDIVEYCYTMLNPELSCIRA